MTYNKILKARVTSETKKWYKTQAKERNISVSEFIRQIPTIINKLKELLDEKDDMMLELKERKTYKSKSIEKWDVFE